MDGLPDLRFDYAGALNAARKLWALADSTDTFAATRNTAAENAAADWQGPLVDQFKTRIDAENQGWTSTSTQLRTAAQLWAQAWMQAINETNRRRRARKVTQVRNDRNWFQNVFTDDDSESKVRQVKLVSQPQPPSFAATGSLQRF